MAKISYHVFFFYITISRFYNDSLSCCFTILSEQCSKNNCPIIKTKPFEVTHIKKEWWIQAKVGEDKNLCHYFTFVIKK